MESDNLSTFRAPHTLPTGDDASVRFHAKRRSRADRRKQESRSASSEGADSSVDSATFFEDKENFRTGKSGNSRRHNFLY